MKKARPYFLFLICSLLIISCDGDYKPDGDSKTIAWDLRGTWESSDPSVFNGRLVIGSNIITITNYSESQTNSMPEPKDDNKRPFKAFTKGTALKAYTEDQELFIEDAGIFQDGLSYTYWASYPNKFLRFSFGGRDETLKKVADF